MRRGVRAVVAALSRGRTRRPLPQPAFALRRERLDGVAHLSGTITIAARQWGGVVRALAATVADAVAGHTLGEAEIVAGEAPILASFAARRDLVAGRVVGALTAGATHRWPTLWLALNEGVFLAAAVDPDRPLLATPESVATIVRTGRAARALITAAAPRGAGVALRFAVFARPPDLRGLLRSARVHLVLELDRTSAR